MNTDTKLKSCELTPFSIGCPQNHIRSNLCLVFPLEYPLVMTNIAIENDDV